MPPTHLHEVHEEGYTTFRRFEDEQVGRGMLSNMQYGSIGQSREEAVLVTFFDAHSYYDHAGVSRIDGESIGDAERAIENDAIAERIVLEGIKVAKALAEQQEAIFGDGRGLEHDAYWAGVEV